MFFLSILFLTLELAILSTCVYVGYRRGTGRSAVRLVYLSAIALLSFFVGRLISFTLSKGIVERFQQVLPTDLQGIFAKAPELNTLFANLIGALIAPISFAALFAILQGLSFIYLNTVSDKLISLVSGPLSKICPKRIPSHWNAGIGAGIGLLSGIIVAAALLSPLFTVTYVIENTPKQTLEILEESLSKEKNNTESELMEISLPAEGAMKVSPSAGLTHKSFISISRLSPLNVGLLKPLTNYEFPSKDKLLPAYSESASDTLPALMEAVGDALYAYKQTEVIGGTSVEAFTNAAAAIIPHIDHSPMIKQAASDALSAMGQALQGGGSVMGFSLPQTDDAFIQSMIDGLIGALAATTPETVSDNMIMLFGELDDSLKPEFRNDVSTEDEDVLYDGDPVEIEATIEQADPDETDAPIKVDASTDTVTETKSTTEKTTTAKPTTSKPKETKTTTAKATEAKPKETKPTTTKPTTTKPAETKPAETKPAETKPAETGKSTLSNKGLLSALSKLDTSDPLGALQGGSSDLIKDALGSVANNPAMSGVIDEIRAYAMKTIQEAGINILDETFRPMYETTLQGLLSVLNDCVAKGNVSTSAVSTQLEIFLVAELKKYQFPLDDSKIGILAQYATTQFMSDKYIKGNTVNIALKDIMLLFGFKESELPEWAL